MRLALLAVLLLAAAAYAATWAVWVPVQNNSPSSGASSTFGNYWGYGAVFYSTAAVKWIVPPMPERGSASFYNITSYLGASGAVSVYATSSQTTLSGYMYAGAASASYTVPLGTSTSISSTYGVFALAAVSISSEYCGSLYFVELVGLGGTSNPVYVAASLSNSTWGYLTFYNATSSSTSASFSQSLPSACYSPGTYLLAVSIYTANGISSVAAVQISNSSSGAGASYVPGTQYALSISPASGDTVVFPWTTSASPYVVLMSAASILNTAGSPASGYFSIAGTNPVYLPSSALLLRDSSTPTPSIAAANCPGVYFLPASAAVSKLLSCSGMSAPSGAAVYPTDYSKYTSTATSVAAYPLGGGYPIAVAAVGYTDSAGASWSAQITSPTADPTISVYISSPSISLPQQAYYRNPIINFPHVYAGIAAFYPPSNASSYWGTSFDQPVLQVSPGIGAVFWQANYTGENVTISFLGTYTNSLGVAADGYFVYLFITPSTWAVAPQYNYSVPSIVWYASCLGATIFPQSSSPYIFVHYDPGWRCWHAAIVSNSLNVVDYAKASPWWTYGVSIPQPSPSDLINVTVIYDPSSNTVTAFAINLNTGQTTSITANFSGYYAPPPPGRYVFGIGAIGSYYTNWALLAVSFSQGGARPSTDVYIAASTPTKTAYIPAPSAAVWTSTPSVTAGAANYVPVPGPNTIYVGPQVLTSIPSWSTVSISPTVATTAMLYAGGWRLPLYGGYTAYFAPSASATFGTTPNGLRIYWLSSNSTSYTAPSTPHSSTLTIPAIDRGVYVGASLGNWWNASRAFYTASLIATGGPPPYSAAFGGVQNWPTWKVAWDFQNPPSVPVYMAGADGKTYAFVPSWVQQLGLAKILAGGGMPVLYVWGRPISQSSLAFVSGGVWLNYTQASGLYVYFPYLGSPGSMAIYANSTSATVGSWALQIVDEGLSPTSASSANVTVWMYNGALSGSFFFPRPFSYLAFPAGGSLGPLWLLLNSTIGVPPYIAQVFPSATQLVVSRGGYTAVNAYVSVPSQLFNQWSGNLVFAAAQMSPSGSYALMSGGFYSSPPTSFTIMLPVKAIGQLAYFLMASWPSGGTCSLLQQVSSPLELTICQGAPGQSIAINLGTATVSSPASFSGLAGAWAGLAGRVAPVSAILANAGVAALVVLMVRRGRSLTAGLMTAGALVTALGLSLWLPWMIGEGAVMFVVASAVAFTRR